MHDHGIPERKDWPPGALDEILNFRQGDLVADLPLFYWADPSHSVHARTRFYAAQGQTDATVIRFAEVAPFGLITTQTCDLAQEGDRKPNSAWVHLAPVFDAEADHPAIEGKRLHDGGARKLIKQGRDQFRLLIPNVGADGLWYADLTFEVPVERGWLAQQTRKVGFSDEKEREELGKRLAWLRCRPAFDTRFVEAVQQPIVASLRQLAKDDRDTYERMFAQVAEIGVRLNSRLAVSQADLTILHNGADADLLDWWRNLWVALNAKADALGFNLLPLRVENLSVLSAGEYRTMKRLPLAAISSNPAWYGADPEGDPGAE